MWWRLVAYDEKQSCGGSTQLPRAQPTMSSAHLGPSGPARLSRRSRAPSLRLTVRTFARSQRVAATGTKVQSDLLEINRCCLSPVENRSRPVLHGRRWMFRRRITTDAVVSCHEADMYVYCICSNYRLVCLYPGTFRKILV